jgi:hypothetical protein
MLTPKLLIACAALLGSLGPAVAQHAPATPYDAELARSLGADESGMRSYVLVVLAGPFDDGAAGWRGMFIFATPDIEEARKYVATDPVIVNGEMVAEYHQFYGSAALMAVNGIHAKIEKK